MRGNMNEEPHPSLGGKGTSPTAFCPKTVKSCGEKMSEASRGACRSSQPLLTPRQPTAHGLLPLRPSWALAFAYCLAFISLPGCSADFLQAARRQQALREHQFAPERTSPAHGYQHAKNELVKSLGLVDEDTDTDEEKEVDAAESYSDILEKLERIVRQEDGGREQLHITLEPSAAPDSAAGEAEHRRPRRSVRLSASQGSRLENEGFGLLSALQVFARASSKSAEEGPPAMQQDEINESSVADSAQTQTEKPKELKSPEHTTDEPSQILTKSVSDFQVIEEENGLDVDSVVTIAYNFPLQTTESKQIAFVVMALPPGYKARSDGSACDSLDPEMPKLSCTTRQAYMKNRPESLSTFITVSSANYMESLPLGRHSFRVSVRTPSTSLPTDNPANWWFATFRFTGGHAITKHWENRKLIIKRNCIWGEWRQETPCSTTCGGGYEVWTRSLYSGDSEEACGGAFMKRRCQLQECSINCQLDDWVTMADCTKSCGATEHDAFKIRMRKVLMQKVGWGQACRELYPWDRELGMGWSEKMQAVVSISPCDKKFTDPCPSTLGCRVEETNTRTIPDAYPWGACPFPCGGFGTITSIVQVANGIPRWIGEKHFPDHFQIPCRADQEPLVTTRKCNLAACEDCSVYIENPIFGRATRAWFFFIPTAEADIAEVTAPRGVRIVENKALDSELEKPRFKVSSLSELLPPAFRQASDRPRLTPRTDPFTDAEELGTCAQMATSFGDIESCKVSPSRHYAGAQAAQLILKALIEPSVAKDGAKTKSDGHSTTGTRPQWFALPVLLGSRADMEDAGNFYLWLTRSKYPNDPEVFKCHLRTKMSIPHRCKFSYRPKNPAECDQCTSGSKLQIETYRRFIPSLNGGSCDVPHALRERSEVLVKTSCLKGCSQLHPKEVGAGRAHKDSNTQKQQQQRPAEAQLTSRLERMTRRELETFVRGKALLAKEAAAGNKGQQQEAEADLEAVFQAQLRAIDEVAMPLIQEGTGELTLDEAAETETTTAQAADSAVNAEGTQQLPEAKGAQQQPQQPQLQQQQQQQQQGGGDTAAEQQGGSEDERRQTESEGAQQTETQGAQFQVGAAGAASSAAGSEAGEQAEEAAPVAAEGAVAAAEAPVAEANNGDAANPQQSETETDESASSAEAEGGSTNEGEANKAEAQDSSGGGSEAEGAAEKADRDTRAGGGKAEAAEVAEDKQEDGSQQERETGDAAKDDVGEAASSSDEESEETAASESGAEEEETGE